MGLLQETIRGIEPQSAQWRAKAKARLDRLAVPYWALGRLQDLALDLAGMTRSMHPPVEKRAVIVCAGDHGVAAEGVSAFPQEVTPQMVANFVRGGASINALARGVNAEVWVADFGVAADLSALGGGVIDKKVGWGTANIALGPAMTQTDAVRALEGGIDLARELSAHTGLFATGDMGIANTTPSAAICAVLTGVPVRIAAGRGTGITDDGLAHKIAVIERALKINDPDPENGLDILAKVGGFEIGGIAGVILGAAAARRPVLIDGFISTAGALIAQALCPAAADYMIAAHRSEEQGHKVMLDKLGKEPLLDLHMRLGEGTGAVVAMPLVDAAARVLTDILTFEEVAVTPGDGLKR